MGETGTDSLAQLVPWVRKLVDWQVKGGLGRLEHLCCMQPHPAPTPTLPLAATTCGGRTTMLTGTWERMMAPPVLMTGWIPLLMAMVSVMGQTLERMMVMVET